MEDLKEVSDEDLKRPGPRSLTDERAAEELCMSVDELVYIMGVWEKHAGQVAKERHRRYREKVANERRTVVK